MAIPRGVLNCPPTREVLGEPIVRTIVFEALAAEAVAIRPTTPTIAVRRKRRLRRRPTPWEKPARPTLSTRVPSRADKNLAVLALLIKSLLLSRDPRGAPHSLAMKATAPWRVGYLFLPVRGSRLRPVVESGSQGQ